MSVYLIDLKENGTVRGVLRGYRLEQRGVLNFGIPTSSTWANLIVAASGNGMQREYAVWFLDNEIKTPMGQMQVVQGLVQLGTATVNFRNDGVAFLMQHLIDNSEQGPVVQMMGQSPNRPEIPALPVAVDEIPVAELVKLRPLPARETSEFRIWRWDVLLPKIYDALAAGGTDATNFAAWQQPGFDASYINPHLIYR